VAGILTSSLCCVNPQVSKIAHPIGEYFGVIASKCGVIGGIVRKRELSVVIGESIEEENVLH
jgi:hypothetical protein